MVLADFDDIDSEVIESQTKVSIRRCRWHIGTGRVWGSRVEGKILTIQYAREHAIPFRYLPRNAAVCNRVWAQHVWSGRRKLN